MSQSGLWISRFLIFIVFVIIGCSIGFVFMFIWGPHIPLWMPFHAEKQPETMISDNLPETTADYGYNDFNNKSNIPVKESTRRGQPSLSNPFIVPTQYRDNHSQNISLKKKQAYLAYQGIIETNDGVLGIVKVNTTGEVFIVYEGEDLLEFEIKKITPSTLTYSKNGNEVIIPLGGIGH